MSSLLVELGGVPKSNWIMASMTDDRITKNSINSPKDSGRFQNYSNIAPPTDLMSKRKQRGEVGMTLAMFDKLPKHDKKDFHS